MNVMVGTKGARQSTGFTSVEVMLAVVLLGIALVPLLRTMTDTGREAGFSESHLLAHARIQAILDATEAKGWVSLPRGTVTTELPVPAAAGRPPEELWGASPEVYDELLEAEQVGDGLVRLGARIRWLPSGLSNGRHPIEAASVRFLRRADGSWTRAMSLERPGTTPVAEVN